MAGFACPNANRYKALALLALLAGHEAVRVNNVANETRAAMKASAGPSDKGNTDKCKDDMCAEDKLCEYKWGVKNLKQCKPTDKCEWLPLPMDSLLPGAKCRISDKHMAKDPKKYMPLQVKLLNHKLKKLQDECISPENLKCWTCRRRWAQVDRAFTWISEHTDQDSKDEYEEIQTLYTTFLGSQKVADDLKMVNQQLRDKDSKLMQTLQQQGAKGVPKLAEMLASVVDGTYEEFGVIQDDNVGTTEEEDKLATELVNSEDVKATIKVAKEVNEIQVDPEKESNGTSLIETTLSCDAVTVGTKVAVLGMVTIAIGLFIAACPPCGAALVSWTLTVFGICFVKEKMVSRWKSEGGFKQCVSTWISAPFKYGAKAAKWLYRKIVQRKKYGKDANIDWSPNWKINKADVDDMTDVDESDE